MHVHGYAALRAGGPLEPYSYDLSDPAPDEVRVAVECCGLCASDLDVVAGIFSGTVFPAVVGHEVIGTVEAIGGAIDHLAVGQRVGIGPQRGACLRCEWCIRGETQVCRRRVFTIGAGHPGGLATSIQVPAAFAFPIPESLTSAEAAPLLCAGVTVYSPLRRYLDHPGRVGIVGVGGLGHLAIQLSAAFGHEVVAFSRAPSAAEEARQRALGAHRVIDMDDARALREVRESLDLVLSLVYGEVDLLPYVTALRPHGTLCLIGNVSPPDFREIGKQLVYAERRLAGSANGGRGLMAEMLRFAASHRIGAVVERLTMKNVNEAIDRMRRGEIRYRAVLERDG